MPNTNVLAGLKCPKCESYGPYIIASKCFARVTDDGIFETWEHEWGPSDFCRCVNCNYTGTVNGFEPKRKPSGNKKGGKKRG